MHIQISKKSVRYTRIQVNPDGSVRVSAPKRLSDRAIADIIESKKTRILKQQEKFKQSGANRIQLAANQLLLHGEAYTFIFLTTSRASRDRFLVDHEQKTISSSLDLANTSLQLDRYKTYAKNYLSQKLLERAEKHGLQYNKLFIRDQKTKRWTCSSKKNISLNRKLVKTPEYISDYVICHELAHLREMNHSKRFWAVVDSFYANKENAIKRMKRQRITRFFEYHRQKNFYS